MRAFLKSTPRVCIVLGILLMALTSFAYTGDSSSDRGDAKAPPPPRQLEPVYKVQAGIDGEIYPVFANYASLQRQQERTFGVVSITISNPGEVAVHRRMAVSIIGWSDQEIQIVDLPAGSTRNVLFAPTFLARFYLNHEIVAATAHVTVSDTTGQTVYESTLPVRLRSAEDIYWGKDFKYAPFIASWVTPHDKRVEAVLAKAKHYTPDDRLPGYESWKGPAEQEQETYREARAIFIALQRLGLSYVKSSSTLGDHQGVSERVRMPRVSLGQSSANCIDAAVMYASLFENLGMESSVAIVPGHAYAGVRVAPGSSKFLFIDVALTGRTTFAAAVASAQTGLARHGGLVTEVMVGNARSAGIYPMP